MKSNSLALYALTLTLTLTAPASVAADPTIGKREYDRICPPGSLPTEHEVSPGYKATYYCDTLPPLQGKSQWNLPSIDACALACNTPECRGASWEKRNGICWLYTRDPAEGGGYVWITADRAFSGPGPSPGVPSSCPADLAACQAGREQCLLDKGALDARYRACEAARLDCEGKLAVCSAGGGSLAACEKERGDCLGREGLCNAQLKTCRDSLSAQDCSACLRELDSWSSPGAPGTCLNGMWKTESLNGKKIVTLCGYTTNAKLAQHPATLAQCVDRCALDPACKAVNYDRQWQACYTASVIGSDGIKPNPNSDVVLLVG
ncbi:uncharacterized protein DSM5745_01301 [Aspergillus mulundensis]|uniref:Apple domain-containing protein n=1 Tax=Aspergillus mulundensis TaxID=1810919 RepID=A0A3D8T616_9EURO|nr:hypothetical protein DSM5745_01301 [Aspergillus mulundensis]RDW93979.1 hypothetical protein DSM5745_01301 [Aspergillus mulundensis]